MLKRIAFLALLAAGSTNAADRNPSYDFDFDYACKIDVKGPGWTPKASMFSLDLENKTALVYDPVLIYSELPPATAKIVKSRPDLVRFKWRVSVPTLDAHRVSVGYRIDFNPQDLTGKIHVAIRSNAGAIYPGFLTCEKVKV